MSGSDMPQQQQQQQQQVQTEPEVKEREELMHDVEEGEGAVEGQQDVRGEKQGGVEKVLEKVEPGLKES
ncbi:MAG: hypothetical protein L6R42_011320 [Xanthoria sp. 1 TBL-2021]|nr:MAG: hypothetical protein L6R42_011320 [Xanthoria sp. 1 TBL-2021]